VVVVVAEAVVVVVAVLPIIYLCETYHMSTLVLLNIPVVCNLKSSPVKKFF
jgi:hypothetical protein